jgi:long-chain fatty acid transport protein
VSAVWKFNQQWEFMADAQWTGWSSITDLTFYPTDGSVLPGVPLEWDDTWKFAVGTSYRYNEKWKARFGVAFDQTPVTTHPTVRLPDSDRWWITVGGEYRWTPQWKFDAGLVYIKGDKANFDQHFSTLEAANLGQIRGYYNASVWILSAQAAYVF